MALEDMDSSTPEATIEEEEPREHRGFLETLRGHSRNIAMAIGLSIATAMGAPKDAAAESAPIPTQGKTAILQDGKEVSEANALWVRWKTAIQGRGKPLGQRIADALTDWLNANPGLKVDYEKLKQVIIDALKEGQPFLVKLDPKTLKEFQDAIKDGMKSILDDPDFADKLADIIGKILHAAEEIRKEEMREETGVKVGFTMGLTSKNSEGNPVWTVAGEVGYEGLVADTTHLRALLRVGGIGADLKNLDMFTEVEVAVLIEMLKTRGLLVKGGPLIAGARVDNLEKGATTHIGYGGVAAALQAGWFEIGAVLRTPIAVENGAVGREYDGIIGGQVQVGAKF